MFTAKRLVKILIENIPYDICQLSE